MVVKWSAKMLEIGSEFSLPTEYLREKNTNQFAEYSDYPAKIFLSSGRGALRLIAKGLKARKGDEVLLPSYLCKEVVKPFKDELLKVKFYKVDETLRVDIDDLRSKVGRKTRALLFIHYFGFPQKAAHEIKALCRGGIFLVEDLVQSFLTRHQGKVLGSIGDATISSYRKWIPIPDGALLGINNTSFHVPPVKRILPDKNLYVKNRLQGLELKGSWLKQSTFSKETFRRLFLSADKLLDTTPVEVSDRSRRMLLKFDLDAIVNRRRANFRYLLNHLVDFKSATPFYRKLPAGVCPLGFPLLAKDRDGLKKMLIKNRIYPPIHWKLLSDVDKEEFSASWQVSKHILTIPIDQRYKTEDMQFVADIIGKFEATT
jgi:dTDP-4-amino-4,6-dideoxygalactose transaminase